MGVRDQPGAVSNGFLTSLVGIVAAMICLSIWYLSPVRSNKLPLAAIPVQVASEAEDDGRVDRQTDPDYRIQSPDILEFAIKAAAPNISVAGEHLVRPDGTVNLAIYGSVAVAGCTIAEAEDAITRQLSKHFAVAPVHIEVLSYAAKPMVPLSRTAQSAPLSPQ